MSLGFLRFEAQGYLLLLLLLPLIVVTTYRSLAGLGPVRRWLAIGMRCLVITAMVFALAGVQRVKSTDALSVIALVDRSNSVPREWQEQAVQFLTAAEGGLRENKDRLGVIAFDGSSAIEQLPMNNLAIEHLTEPVAPDQTDIAGALRMGMALFPPDASRRLLLVSDGNENVGEVLDEATQFAAAGVPIDVYPVEYRHRNEVSFVRLDAPQTAAVEETINLGAVLRSERPVSGRILVYQNDELVQLGANAADAGFHVRLEPGPTRYNIPMPLREGGAHRFRAVFVPDDAADDTLPANNEGRAFTVVAGQGRILVLTTEAEMPSAQLLVQALQRERLVCDLELAGDTPLTQERLLGYSLVILANVPAAQLQEEEQKGLAVYVRELGGGLVMTGGDESFGPGGWMGSPIEEVMPVTFDVKSKRQIPRGALVLVMHACEIPRGNYWGERVAIAAVKTLSSRDLVGVLSYQWLGADHGYWVVPLGPVEDKTRVVQLIRKMDMGDMPSLEEVVEDGLDALKQDKTSVAKHMIIISDFDPVGPSDGLLGRLKEAGVTCSTVAIGFGGHPIDLNKARKVAEITGGKFHSTRDYSELPKIFIKEARIVRRALLYDKPFPPVLVDPLAATTAGLTGEKLPSLGGMVLTTAKPLAEVPLVRKSEDADDPVLAEWQVGAGKTVAFTSGMWHRWGADWVAWQKFSTLWAQISRWASRQTDAAAFDVATTVQGGRGHMRVDAVDKNAAAINFMSLQGVVVRPDYSSTPLRLTQTGPGRYEAEFDARQSGSYVVSLAYSMGTGEDATSGRFQSGVSVSYSPEYADLETNVPLLAELAQRTGGRVLTANEAREIFARGSLPLAETRRSIWEDLVRWTLILFLLDIAIRRIAITPASVARKAREFLRDMAGRRRPAAESAAVLTTLKGTRERVREDMVRPPAGEAGLAPDRGRRYEGRPPDAKVADDLSRALGGATEQDAPVVARPPRKKAAQTEGDYTSRLLEAKRRARGDIDQKKDKE